MNEAIEFGLCRCSRSLKSKWHSLRSILKVYDNAFGILKVYFFGGRTFAALTDSCDNKLLVEVSKENVKRIISLSNILYELHEKYEIIGNEIKCEPYPNMIITLGHDFTEEELHLLTMHQLLGKYITSNVIFDNDHYLAKDTDGFNWILRKASLLDDAAFGLLLPILLNLKSIDGSRKLCAEAALSSM